jgi:hypothetical protein
VPLGGKVLALCYPRCRGKQTPAAAPHGGMDLTRWIGACRYGVRCTFVENFDSIDYFSKITNKLNIKKIRQRPQFPTSKLPSEKNQLH